MQTSLALVLSVHFSRCVSSCSMTNASVCVHAVCGQRLWKLKPTMLAEKAHFRQSQRVTEYVLIQLQT